MTVYPETSITALTRLATAAQQLRTSDEFFTELETCLQVLLGFHLFTVLLYNPSERKTIRRYSSNPSAYPVGGWKPVVERPWTTQLLIEGRVFVGSSAQSIRDNFADADLILSLGCESVLNIPVVSRGRVIGTINLLREADGYSNADIGLAKIIAALAIAPLEHATKTGAS